MNEEDSFDSFKEQQAREEFEASFDGEIYRGSLIDGPRLPRSHDRPSSWETCDGTYTRIGGVGIDTPSLATIEEVIARMPDIDDQPSEIACGANALLVLEDTLRKFKYLPDPYLCGISKFGGLYIVADGTVPPDEIHIRNNKGRPLQKFLLERT